MAKNQLEYKADIGRHSHDVSGGYTSTITTGPIVPQYFDLLQPGDSVYYQTHLFARFQNLVTAFLGEVDLHIDYFFVPLQMMYLQAGSILTNTNEQISSSFKNWQQRSFPLLDVMQSAAIPSNPFGFIYGHDECWAKELARLLNGLDMNPLVSISNALGQRSSSSWTRPEGSIMNDYCINPAVVPWALGAYQAIYQKYYRNDELEMFNVQCYNIDQYYNQTSFVNDHLLRLRYIQRPSDYFTNIRVSPIFSAVNALGNTYSTTEQQTFPANGGNPMGTSESGNNLFSVLQWLGARPQNYSPQTYGETFDDTVQNSFNFVGVSQSTPTGDFEKTWLNANNIRALFALDKYQRIFGRAKKTYDDQILAHFGIHIPHDAKHDITHLKHYRCVLQADPVISSSYNGTEESSQLGQIGGQGSVSLNSDGEKFTAPVHGIFMAVMYAVSKPRYIGTYSRLHDLYDFHQYPQPEFDKLGAEPQYYFESDPYYLHESSLRGVRNGWHNRYLPFKQKYNRASIFYMGENVEFGSHTAANNIYKSWILARSPYYSRTIGAARPVESQFVQAFRLFESPHALDTVMVRPYVGLWSNDYFTSPFKMFETDPLVTEFYCNCKKVSWMSPTGEPDL